MRTVDEPTKDVLILLLLVLGSIVVAYFVYNSEPAEEARIRDAIAACESRSAPIKACDYLKRAAGDGQITNREHSTYLGIVEDYRADNTKALEALESNMARMDEEQKLKQLRADIERFAKNK